jgi:hypothetical protein
MTHFDFSNLRLSEDKETLEAYLSDAFSSDAQGAQVLQNAMKTLPHWRWRENPSASKKLGAAVARAIVESESENPDRRKTFERATEVLGVFSDNAELAVAAAVFGDNPAALRVIAKRSQIDWRDATVEFTAGKKWPVALVAVISDSSVETLSELVSLGADAEALAPGAQERVAALGMAAWAGRVNAMAWLFGRLGEEAKKTALGLDATPGGCLLLLAARNGKTDAARWLIEAGANVNAKNEDGDSALMLAASADHPECVRALLDAGADIDARGNGAETALTLSAREKWNKSARVLAERGADASLRNEDGDTALLCATRNGNEDAVAALLANGADPDAPDRAGRTPLMIAAETRQEAIAARLAACSNPLAKNKGGESAIELAFANGLAEAVEAMSATVDDETAVKIAMAAIARAGFPRLANRVERAMLSAALGVAQEKKPDSSRAARSQADGSGAQSAPASKSSAGKARL